MNEMLRNLGFGDITSLVTVDYFIESTDLETMKRHVEEFMRMVGKCIQVNEE